MPRRSERAKAIEFLQVAAIVEELFADEEIDDPDDLFDDDEYGLGVDVTSPAFLLHFVQSRRYFNVRRDVPKSSNWVENVLPQLDEGRFRAETRVSRQAFDFILSKIQDHPVFQNTNENLQQQLPVERQLHVALHRFGRYGNGVSQKDVANRFGIGEGTTEKVTRRVITSLLSLEKEYACWFSQDE